jgi:two-component system cell cycle response regulator
MPNNMRTKILVVEDDTAIRGLIHMYLEKSGFEPFAANSAEKALDILEDQEIGIVLTDIQLPGLNGLELTKIIRRKYHSDVIIMTGYSLDYTIEEAMARGASDLIIKPVRLEDLLLRINVVLKKRSEKKENSRKLEELKNLTIRDDLTGLFNSRQFYSHISQEVDRSNRYFRPLSLILMDIDNFKLLNDTHGHLFGDKILSGMGDIIKSAIRMQDTAYRYAGDEFTIILPETELEMAIAVAERVRQAIENETKVLSDPRPLKVTVSIGVVEYLTDEEIKNFVHRADSAMYASKKKGRNSISFVPTLAETVK